MKKTTTQKKTIISKAQTQKGYRPELKLVNGEYTTKDGRKIKTNFNNEEMSDVKEAFDFLDIDQSGKINKEELKKLCSNLGVNVPQASLDKLMADIDANGDDEMDLDEFVGMLAGGQENYDTMESYQRAFDMIAEGKDKIDVNDLKKVCQLLSDDMSDEDLEFLIRVADKNADHKVDFDEFYNLMTTGTM